MRARRVWFAVPLLLALGVVAACTGSPADDPPAVAPSPVATPAPTATPRTAATPAPTATPRTAATPAPTPTAAATSTPPMARYDKLDGTGAVATAGSWAFLGADGGVLTAWEDLRGSAAALRLHQNDADGTSQAAAWGAVAEGDLVEWRKADDCWVRYLVTGAPAHPASGSRRWEFPVERMTYAATGAGCTGAVGASDTLTVDGDAPSVVPASGIASPVRHGPYLVYPPGWTGALEPPERHEPLGERAAPAGQATATPSPLVVTQDLAEARRLLPYWRDPALPVGWELVEAASGTHDSPVHGYCATYGRAWGYFGAEICVDYKGYQSGWGYMPARSADGWLAIEPRVVDGRAALVSYSPHDSDATAMVWIFDAETRVEYWVWVIDPGLGRNVDAVIAIARSLLPTAGAP